ncbi:F-box protein [Cucumis melo var. makuwa]|uniref:F-box protein n=1 Tax=Cucumis melo var. makuwa TaxID=1194695 RepID=A0A5D3BSQ7_CUCMM|nr:F-box protein [Cucumis melo var. makuwa]TYK02713.1 F-box protein [Cucumis melo var. makuwa]
MARNIGCKMEFTPTYFRTSRSSLSSARKPSLKTSCVRLSLKRSWVRLSSFRSSSRNKFVRSKPQVRHKPPLLKLCCVRTTLSSEVASVRRLKVFDVVMRRLKMKLNRLWVDLLAHIFAMITSFTDLAQACGVCRKWKEGVKLSLGRRNSLSLLVGRWMITPLLALFAMPTVFGTSTCNLSLF